MSCRLLRIVLALVLAQGLAGCDSSRAPVAPSLASGPQASPQPAPPAGGIQMKGTVSDTAFRSLAGARVEVLDGPQAGLSTTAAANGEFSFTGAFDETTRFRATKEGHVTATRTLQPFCARCNPNWWINFALEVLAPPVNMAGAYTMRFIAASSCAILPSELRTRTYDATIPSAANALPANAYLGVTVTGSTFYKDWNVLGFGVAGDYVGFWLETLVEQLAPNTFLAFSGLAAASIGTPAGSTIDLPFAGSIAYCVTKSAAGRFEDCFQAQTATNAQCESSNHRLILTRR